LSVESRTRIVRDLLEILAPERIQDLYRLNPEPTGFRLRYNGFVHQKVYDSYEALERDAITNRLNGWSAEPVYQ
jgi:hypothetical protein